jgi:DNA modification methylase
MINLMHGDCLELMKTIPDNSIDMVLTDPPYQNTSCAWDKLIPFEPMWKELKRITKDNGAICLFGSEPFSSHLRLSNLKMFRYDWIWKKTCPKNFMNAKKQPLRASEIISVFYKRQANYHPQGLVYKEVDNSRPNHKTKREMAYNDHSQKRTISKATNYPIEIQEFPNPNNKSIHPTQKPVALLEYLIRTYTIEGETVLDFTMGSGSTGVAAKNLNRKFIGIEMDDKYFNIAKERIGND